MNAFRFLVLVVYGIPAFVVLLHWIANAGRFMH
jgi:hypothetical protein